MKVIRQSDDTGGVEISMMNGINRNISRPLMRCRIETIPQAAVGMDDVRQGANVPETGRGFRSVSHGIVGGPA